MTSLIGPEGRCHDGFRTDERRQHRAGAGEREPQLSKSKNAIIHAMKPKPASKPKRYRSVARNSREHRALAIKAAAQAQRALPYFEKEHPDDDRPRKAIAAIRAWAQGKLELGMAEVRRLSLGSHAAAREARTDAARSAARAAGQAVATWHVPNHASAVPEYVRKAVRSSRLSGDLLPPNRDEDRG